MVELQSDKNQSDRYRMLPQSACSARLERNICDCTFIQLSTLPQSARVLDVQFVHRELWKGDTIFLFQRDDDSEVKSEVSYSRTSNTGLKGPLDDLPGPLPESFLLGNLRQLMREQVGTYDVKLEDIYGMVARTNQCTFRHTSFLIAVERRDSLTSKPSRMTGCGSLIKSHSIYFANFTLQYREVIRCTVRA
ncbi:hypothetical protein BJV77DRAFT_266819 [Russula vinacea]|nr:hypothetical protein BJV77DRAFT_266819 [Russula vinacea]